jgi:dTDP-4-dehydrorhamnose 3,5-epimerase-like enzyme
MRTEPYLIKGGVAVDDRGVVTFCNEFDMSKVKRFYFLENHRQGFVRAWHGHRREAKWITVLSGVGIIAVAKLNGDKLELPQRYTMHANGDVLYVPGGYANGHKNLVPNTKVMHFSNMTIDETVNDDIRIPAYVYGSTWIVEER